LFSTQHWKGKYWYLFFLFRRNIIGL